MRLRKKDEAVPVPWLVSSVETDGLQVKVLLATIVKAMHSEEDAWRRRKRMHRRLNAMSRNRCLRELLLSARKGTR